MKLLIMASAFAATFASVPDQEKPPTDLVARIETELSKNPCVGSLNNWWRQYSFQVRAGKVNENFVSVHFVEAGHNGLPSGQFITAPFTYKGDIDDSQHRLIYAEYEIATGRLTMRHCGWNFPQN